MGSVITLNAQVEVSPETAAAIERFGLSRFGEMIHEQTIKIVGEAMLLEALYGLTTEQAMQAAMCLGMRGDTA
jgi:hypothetical protein